MADAVADLWPDRAFRIADVAAGKGYLRAALYQRGYHDVTCFDRRPRKAHRPYYRYQHLDSSVKVRGQFDLLLGMHPDEATDAIVVRAAEAGVPFAIVPCCVRPTASVFWGEHRYDRWVEHLRTLGEISHVVTEHELPITGRSLMLVGTPVAEVERRYERRGAA